MTPEGWRKIRDLLAGALQLEGEERSAYLDLQCSDDPSLRQELDKLIAAKAELPSSFLEVPAAALFASRLVSSSGSSVLAAGTKLGPYAVEALVGAGGMGEVYRARDTRLGRRVAVKVIPRSLSSHPERRQRFQREARAIALLQHPNVCALYDVGAQDGTDYLVMEYLEGETLAARVRNGPLPLDLISRYATEVADALDAFHCCGIVHRDLKPGNIFITAHGETKVLDFGLAKLEERGPEGDRATTSASDTMLSTPGAPLGTVAYMSPEQARGESLDARTDIFSLGAVLYEMAAGRPAFAGRSTAVVFDAILNQVPIPARRFNPQVAGGLEQIINKAIEKNRQARYQSAKEMLADLKRLQHDGVPRRAATATDGVMAKPRVSRRQVVGLASAAGVMTSITAYTALKYYVGVQRPGWTDSIAVLPFLNTSADPELEYLSDGITEGLINHLSQLPGLRVIARPTAFTFKGKPLDLGGVSRMLKVRTVLTGQVTARRQSVSVQADLVSATDGTELWGQRYDPNGAEILEVQSQIVRQISQKLRVAISSSPQARRPVTGTGNVEAYQQYLRGRYQLNQYTPAAWKKALEFFSAAIQHDPGYAAAWAGVADSYYQMSSLVLRPHEAIPKARAAAMKALELDETLAEAHASLGVIKAQYDWDGAGAEREYKRAIALNPSYATAHQWYGILLHEHVRSEEALIELRRAEELDPLTLFIGVSAAWPLHYRGQYVEAAKQLERILEMYPKDPELLANWHLIRGEAFLERRMYRQAAEEFIEKDANYGASPEAVASLKRSFESAGMRGYWQKSLELAEDYRRREAEAAQDKGKYVTSLPLARLYARLGDKDRAFAALEVCFNNRDENLLFLKVESIRGASPWLGIRSDPRFGSLLRRMGLEP